MADSLNEKLIDAAIMTAPYNQLAIQRGEGYALTDPRLGPSGDAAVRLFGTGSEWRATDAYWAIEAFLKAKPSVAHKFAKALAEANVWLSNPANSQRAGAITATHLGSPLLEAPSIEMLKTRLWTPYSNGFTDWQMLQRQADLMADYSIVSLRVDVRRFVELPWYVPS